jgi:N-acetylglutamate synthase-like GNAT family acetyltransferase
MSDPTYRLEVRVASRDEEQAAKACLTEHAAEMAGIVLQARSGKAETMWDGDAPFSILALSHDRVVGGLIGKIFFNWLDAEVVWVEKPLRHLGVGRAVFEETERQARNLSLTGIYLWTQSWQAPDFYRKLGYRQFAEFEDFPPGHRRLGFRKYL